MKSTVLIELVQLLVDASDRAGAAEKMAGQLKQKIAVLEKAAINGGIPLGEEEEGAGLDGKQPET